MITAKFSNKLLSNFFLKIKITSNIEIKKMPSDTSAT
jgi:hypothetical protein